MRVRHPWVVIFMRSDPEDGFRLVYDAIPDVGDGALVQDEEDGAGDNDEQHDDEPAGHLVSGTVAEQGQQVTGYAVFEFLHDWGSSFKICVGVDWECGVADGWVSPSFVVMRV